MGVESDPVALTLAGDRAGPLREPPKARDQRGVVELSGYVLTKERWQLQFQPAPDPPGGVTADLAGDNAKGRVVSEVHLYLTQAFDQWLEIPRCNVRAQRGNVAELSGRSQIWVDDDIEIKHCRLTTAADVAQTLSSGMDDPTALPGKKTRGGG